MGVEAHATFYCRPRGRYSEAGFSRNRNLASGFFMRLSSSQILARLGAGERIPAVCEAAGIPREEFSAWWKRETASRVPAGSGTRPVAVRDSVRIVRDDSGIPHVFSQYAEDLSVGFGYAT